MNTQSNVGDIPTPTNFDLGEALATVWAALDCLPEGALSDAEYGDVCTAMAWLTEAAGLDEVTQ
jgi:hypothetical protein